MMRSRFLGWLRAPFRKGPLERLLLRATLGRPYSGWRAKLTPLHTTYRPATIRRAARHGYDLNLDLSDLIDWYVYWGFVDPSHDAIVARCRAGWTVLDVGANRGMTALRIGTAVGSGGRVIALEPDQDNYSLLEKRLEDNRLGWVTPLRRAVSDTEKSVNVAPREANNSGMHRVAATGDQVDACSIDNLVEELGLGRVDLIKIDVEGYEMRVLRGATRTIERWKPEIVTEVDDNNLRHFGSSRDALIDLLSSRGYRVSDAVTGEPPPAVDHFDALAEPQRQPLSPPPHEKR